MREIKKVVFFNLFHYGDVHVSRTFVKRIVDMMPDIEFSYHHANGPRVLLDIPRLKYEPHNRGIGQSFRFHDSIWQGNTVCLNTWYATLKHRFMRNNDGGLSFGCIYGLFSHHCRKTLKLDISKIPFKKFLPKIDFSYYKTDGVEEFVEKFKGCQKILFCNGEAKSGQAKNFAMMPGIKEIARKHRDKIFIITNREKGDDKLPSNVFKSADIIGPTGGCDLNENAYISTFCDVIVGRYSGVYTFSLIEENYFRPVKMITFSHIRHPTWINPTMKRHIPIKCQVVESNSTNIVPVVNKVIG